MATTMTTDETRIRFASIMLAIDPEEITEVVEVLGKSFVIPDGSVIHPNWGTMATGERIGYSVWTPGVLYWQRAVGH
jgi:hypothetical protein